ncbi:AcCoA-C-Actrans: acetyl-CoA C-acyltransferase [compost metagenome]
MQDIYIHGGAMTPFGRHAGVLAPELAQQAILKALADADVPASRIQAVYCANVLGGMILGQLIVRDLGLKGIPVYNVENACASGATGVRMIADPLTLLQCCPSQVDGAAAVVLSTRRPAQARPVKVLSSVVVSGLREEADDDILDAEITARAARQAYEQAGLGPQDVDVVELHDAFTIAELLYYEALGLAGPGEAVSLLKSGATRLGGRVPVNPSGGLLAKGHPLGATGVAQMVEILWHLQGRAGERQVDNARVGLTQCTGGGIAGVDHAASSVHLLGV